MLVIQGVDRSGVAVVTAGDGGWARPDTRPRGGRHRARGRRGDGDAVVASWLLAMLLGSAACALPSAVPVRPLAQQEVAPPALPVPPLPGLSPALTVALPAVPVTVPVTPAHAGADGALAPAEFTGSLPDDRAGVAVRTALAQIGLPYQWGGNGPTAGDDGFDCSGLTTFAYAAAGIALPRTAATQYAAGPHVPADAALQPGDLVFYGTPGAVHHVGMYIGDAKMVNAPTFGQPVQTAYYRWRGDDYLGATRPAATGTTSPGLLPSAPPEGAPATRRPRPPVFEAPPAPPPTDVPAPSTSLPPEPVSAAAAVAAAGDEVGTDPTPAPTDGAEPTGTTEPSGTTDPSGAADPSSAAGHGVAAEPSSVPGTTDASAPPPATTTLPPTSVAPTTTAPTTEPPATTPPEATTPGTTTTATSGTGVGGSAIDVGGRQVPLVPVPASAVGVPGPPAAGGRIAEGADRTVVALAPTEHVATLLPGTTVTLRGADGALRTWTVRSVRTAPATTVTPALAPAGGLLVVAGTGSARTVVVAS